MNQLTRALAPVKRRMREQRAFLWAMYGLLAGGICAVLLRAATFLWVFDDSTGWVIAALAAPPVLFALAAWLWPLSALDAARQADALGLMARAQTALMLDGCDTPMAQLQRMDALRELENVTPKQQMPLKAPKPVWICACVCAVLFAMSFLLPNPQAEALKARAEFRKEMEEQAKQIDDQAAMLDAGEDETPELRRILGELSATLKQSANVRTALEAANSAEQSLKRIEKQSGDAAISALRSAGLDALAASLAEGDEQTAETLLSQSSDAAEKLLFAAYASASRNTATKLSAAAQALQAGNGAQALANLRSAVSGQTAGTSQAMSSTEAVRLAAAQAAQGAAGASSQAAGMGSNTGSPVNGAGNQSGSGGSPGTGSNQGAGAGTGFGTSNKDGGSGASGTSLQAGGSRPAQKQTAEYEPIYDPTRAGGSGETVNERGVMGEGQITEVEIGAGAGTLEGSVPYGQVLAQYQQAAVEAVENAALPGYAQKWVETYFNTLAN